MKQRFHPRHMQTDILIYGGGAGGVCAGIQAARLGARVTILEPTVWVGGMITAAGVTALDGNKYALGGGLVKEFRDALSLHYGSEEALFTGWVSLYCFEPHVGQRVLRDFADVLPTLEVLYETEAVAYERIGPRRRRVRARHSDGRETDIECSVFIDASEYGDGLALAGLPYRLGRESRDELGESAAPERPDVELQDMTYVATLARRAGTAPDAPPASAEEKEYWRRFACSTSEICDEPDPERLNHALHDWDSFLGYGLLPNDKFMLNWPFRSNDYPVTADFFEDRQVRRRQIEAAKRHTLHYVRYMQVALGHPEWQLAEDEYPTSDNLPLIPYIRESRRMVNDRIMAQDDVVARPGALRAPLIPNAIAVGDYFLDHHHSRAHQPPGERLEESYPDNAPFQVPVDVFLSDLDSCFLAGEKNIAVSHIINGSTRLQPIVMLQGQALGVLSALAVQQECSPADVPVDQLQRRLIEAGCQLYPVYDVPAGDPLFVPVQELARMRVLREDDPLRLEPEEAVTADEAARWTERSALPLPVPADGMSRREFLTALYDRLSE